VYVFAAFNHQLTVGRRRRFHHPHPGASGRRNCPKKIVPDAVIDPGIVSPARRFVLGFPTTPNKRPAIPPPLCVPDATHFRYRRFSDVTLVFAPLLSSRNTRSPYPRIRVRHVRHSNPPIHYPLVRAETQRYFLKDVYPVLGTVRNLRTIDRHRSWKI